MDNSLDTVWKGTNSASRSVPPSTLRFYMTELANPKSSVAVTSIDVYSLKTKTSPCIMAMTAGPAELLKVGYTPAAKEMSGPELAAYISVARAILNLHETVTRL